MARPATGSVVERKLAGGAVRFALKFRHQGERVYETLGTDAEGWDRPRAEEALKDRLAEVRLGTYVAPRTAVRTAENAAEPSFDEFASQWFAPGGARAAAVHGGRDPVAAQLRAVAVLPAPRAVGDHRVGG